MSDAKFTQGSWKRTKDGFVICGRKTICGMFSRDGEDYVDAQQNSYLIAAAPDLFKTLSRIIEADDLHELSQEEIEAGRAAIKKACGKVWRAE